MNSLRTKSEPLSDSINFYLHRESGHYREHFSVRSDSGVIHAFLNADSQHFCNAYLGGWMVYPALTDNFKRTVGLLPAAPEGA